ncbi:MAG: hypothetical protein NC826_03470 [Candidatus Omnitrophica bacterium]|nr:hypothetical protein [Candidatus Omnitrophota bacterium]
MAEEVKTEEKKEEKKIEIGKIISTILKVILGVVFLVLGVWAIVVWWKDLILVIKGCVGPFLILAGIITLAIAKE